MHPVTLRSRVTVAVLLPLALAACKPAAPAPTAEPAVAATPAASAVAALLPSDNAIAGWTTADPAKTFGHDDLFSLVDGQSDSFFVYNFEQVATQRYQNSAGTLLTVEIWQVANSADAYGLFTFNRAGGSGKLKD